MILISKLVFFLMSVFVAYMCMRVCMFVCMGLHMRVCMLTLMYVNAFLYCSIPHLLRQGLSVTMELPNSETG